MQGSIPLQEQLICGYRWSSRIRSQIFASVAEVTCWSCDTDIVWSRVSQACLGRHNSASCRKRTQRTARKCQVVFLASAKYFPKSMKFQNLCSYPRYRSTGQLLIFKFVVSDHHCLYNSTGSGVVVFPRLLLITYPRAPPYAYATACTLTPSVSRGLRLRLEHTDRYEPRSDGEFCSIVSGALP